MADPRSDLRLSPADQVLVNCAIMLVAGIGNRDADRKLALDCAAEAMVRCNRDHALISRLTTALAAMAEPTRNLRAEMDLSNTLADIGKLRLAGALDAMHATQGVPA